MTTRVSPRILVIHCPAGGGHKAAAIAVAEAAARWRAEITVLNAFALTPRWFGDAYVAMHLRSTEAAPWAYGLGYHRLNHPHPLGDRLRRRIDAAIGRRLVEHVVSRRPDAVIATHFFPLSVLGRARLQGQLAAPLVGVVTDYAAHAFWAEPGVDRYCVARGGPADDLQRCGTPATAITETGIPIKPAFGRVRPLDATDARGPLRVLITSGGFGVGPMAATIRSFGGLTGIELTIVCGSNAARMREAEKAARRTGLPWRVIGFERDMPSRVAEAHVVVGKPGGLTASECLAAGRPMVLVGTCPGQEQHNEEWLRVNGAAIASSPDMAGPNVAALRHHERLATMAAAARQIAAPDAAERVIDAVYEEIRRPTITTTPPSLQSVQPGELLSA